MGLRSFLEDNEGLLEIDAERVAPGSNGSWFRLASGILQDRFISIWPLIEDLEFFEPLAKLTGQEIERRCRKLGAKVVVGCTMTVRHMLEAVRPYVASDIMIDYLGNYPLLPIRAERIWRQNRPTLIFTDVLSTGQGVEDMIAFLASNRVPVAGIMTLVWVRHALSQRVTEVDETRARFKCLAAEGPQVRGYDLVRFRDIFAEARRPADLGGSLAIPVDAETVLPQPQLRGDPLSGSLVDLETEIAETGASGALKIGYFTGQEGRFAGPSQERFTLGFDTGRLIERHVDILADEICGQYKDLARRCGKAPVFVSTPSKENRDFLRTILQHPKVASLEPEYALFSRTDDFDGSYTHILLKKEDEKTVRDRPALILLATIQSAETVRALSAVLSLHNCRDVTIFCVINRANPASASFLARVLRLAENPSSAAAPSSKQPGRRLNRRGHRGNYFELVSLLRVWDLSASDLTKMEAFAHAQFQRYWRRCKSEIMRQLSNADLQYFEPEMLQFKVAGARAEAEFPSDPGEAPARGSGNETVAISLAAKEAFAARNFDRLLGLIREPGLSKNGLFSVYRYLLADPGGLGTNRRTLSESFVAALTQASADIDAVLGNPPSAPGSRQPALAEAIGRERDLLIGAGLFSQLLIGVEGGPDRVTVRGTILNLLRRFGQTPASMPLIARLCNVEWSYAISFAALMLELELGLATDREPAADEDDEGLDDIAELNLGDALDHIRELAILRLRGEEAVFPTAAEIQDVAETHSGNRSALPQLITSTSELIDALTPEPSVNMGQCLAAVRREITWPRPRHTYAAINLETCPEIIGGIYEDNKDKSGAFRFKSHPESENLIRELNHLILTGARLRVLNEHSRRIIPETSENQNWSRYFLGRDEDSLEAHVSLLIGIAQSSRGKGEILAEDVVEIKRLCQAMVRNLWSFQSTGENGESAYATSEFFQYVCNFECKLSDVIHSAVDKAWERLRQGAEGGGRDMPRSKESFAKIAWELAGLDAERLYVLGDKTLLVSAFENFISNFQYSRDFRRDAESGPEVGRITVREGGQKEHVEVSFWSAGGRTDRDESRNRHSTTHDHRRQLSELNCSVDIDDHTADYFEVTVTLPQITRHAEGRRA